jgi:hypothetical protein
MLHLEKLTLYLSVIRCNKNYIDGIELSNDILNYMPRLKKFNFNINTLIYKNNNVVLSSNEDIKHNFVGKEFGSVCSYVDIFSDVNRKRTSLHKRSHPYEFQSRCSIYSLPYRFDCFYYLNNSFPGGIFNNVRYLLVTEHRPFPHNIFKLISESFPVLISLSIVNEIPQTQKYRPIYIEFPYVCELFLNGTHVDYIEQFLFDIYCHFPRLTSLGIDYESLISVTNIFTNDAARFNCSKLRNLSIKGPFVPPENFQQYFPLL